MSVIGIDGSGTTAASLPMLLAAEYQLQSAVPEKRVVNTPDEDHLTVYPDGLPFTARIWHPCSSAGPHSPIIDAFIRS